MNNYVEELKISVTKYLESVYGKTLESNIKQHETIQPRQQIIKKKVFTVKREENSDL